MKTETFYYTTEEGWSVKNFPALDSEQTLVLIFAAPEIINDPTPLKEIAQHYPKSKIIGCSSAGEIIGSHIMDKSIAVAVTQFEKTSLQVAKVKIDKAEDSFSAGETIAKQLNKDDLCGVLVFSDGLGVNGSELVKGLNTIGKENVIITGGLAGDGDRFKKTWITLDREIYTNHIAAVGLYGESIQIGFASRGGWDIFGPERYITRSKGNVLYELDGKPALTLYKEYLGERAEGLPSTGLLFPLAIRNHTEDKSLVRTILGVDEKAQSLIFAGDVPTGYRAQLMRANFDRLIASAGEAGEGAIRRMQIVEPGPVLAIAISCVGRRLLLGERTEEETESILETLPEGTKQLGFYSYGELSPIVAGTCDLHNQTMTLTTFYES